MVVRELKFNQMLLDKFGNSTTISDIDFIFDRSGYRFALEVKEVEDKEDRFFIDESQLIILKWLNEIIDVLIVGYNPTLTKFFLIKPHQIDSFCSIRDVKNGKEVSVIPILKGSTVELDFNAFIDYLTTKLRRRR